MSREYFHEERTPTRWVSLCSVTLVVLVLSGAALHVEALVGWLSDTLLADPARSSAALDRTTDDRVASVDNASGNLPYAEPDPSDEKSASAAPDISSPVDQDFREAAPPQSRGSVVDPDLPSGFHQANEQEVAAETAGPGARDGSVADPDLAWADHDAAQGASAAPRLAISSVGQTNLQDATSTPSDDSAVQLAGGIDGQEPATMPPAGIPSVETPVQSNARQVSFAGQYDEHLLLRRGTDLLAHGDIASARLFFERAVETGSGRGAIELAKSFDPIILKARGAMMLGDSRRAETWYLKAIEFGRLDAQPLLDALLAGQVQR
jgi:hypothetical protein